MTRLNLSTSTWTVTRSSPSGTSTSTQTKSRSLSTVPTSPSTQTSTSRSASSPSSWASVPKCSASTPASSSARTSPVAPLLARKPVHESPSAGSSTSLTVSLSSVRATGTYLRTHGRLCSLGRRIWLSSERTWRSPCWSMRWSLRGTPRSSRGSRKGLSSERVRPWGWSVGSLKRKKHSRPISREKIMGMSEGLLEGKNRLSRWDTLGKWMRMGMQWSKILVIPLIWRMMMTLALRMMMVEALLSLLSAETKELLRWQTNRLFKDKAMK